MLGIWLTYAVLGLAVLVSAQIKECKTNHGFGPPCVFPYRYKGELYVECTTKFLEDSSDAMCPTRYSNPVTLEASLDRKDWGLCRYDCDLLSYRSTEEIHDKIKNLTGEFPDLARGFVIGTSVKNQPLMGIRISSNVRAQRALLKPMVRFVANIHGNEAVGRELLVHFAQHLLHGYYQDKRIRRLLDTTDISLLPSLNPDGFENAEPGACSGTGRKHGMYNEGDVDLNRDFPTIQDWQRFQTDPNFSVFPGRQPETVAMMDWSASAPFVLSADLHDGAVLVTYPFDFKVEEEDREPNLTPDNDLFVHLASTYVDNHATMKNITKCFRRAEGGMANGAAWYGVNTKGTTEGSLKDFSYLFTNNIELSMELTCCKFPTRYFLLREWENNKKSFLTYIEQVHMGIKGLVFAADGSFADNADIVVWNPDGSRRAKNVTTFSTGEFWKILLPGRRVNTGESTYKIQAFYDDCEGTGRRYASLRQKVVVHEKDPLVTQNLFMRHVGFCGVDISSSNDIQQIQQIVDRNRPNRVSPREANPSPSKPNNFDIEDEDDITRSVFEIEDESLQKDFFGGLDLRT